MPPQAAPPPHPRLAILCRWLPTPFAPPDVENLRDGAQRLRRQDPELLHRERLLGAASEGGGGGQGHHARRRGKEAAMAGGHHHPHVGRGGSCFAAIPTGWAPGTAARQMPRSAWTRSWRSSSGHMAEAAMVGAGERNASQGR
jgi:hypothetical protein